MATNSELRAQVVVMAKSREKKNSYTQGSKRTQVGSGWSDCSSFVRWCYLQVLGVDIGLNTAAQITNAKLQVADKSSVKCPPESALLPGDLLYFKGTDQSRPYAVGHVEMYIGGGKLIGHGSGTGPTIKAMSSYCASRASSGKGYIRTLRVIPDDKQTVVGTDTEQTAVGKVRVTGAQVNVRKGPGTAYDVVKTVGMGDLLAKVEAGEWVPVKVGTAVCWISGKYVEGA